ncbi:MAG: hypothetical protein HS104_20790 [Polyangiaceae bacterium]|nr:hypothetical protein [Polyangiaceae bacterium]MCL4749642.1 DUF1570 domain-containing protein [Myxococcales bacterium]
MGRLLRDLVCALVAVACCRPGPAARPHTWAELESRRLEVVELGQPGFSTKIVPPFILVGDAPPPLFEQDAKVVAWAVRRLKADFFPHDPDPILAIWMFDGSMSYERNVSALWGGAPPSPYGYYSPCQEALVVNASLGNGTLVHELVHAFMDANFPAAPSWYNEGLASLFERPVEANGRIRGTVNTRLGPLKDGWRTGRAPALGALLRSARSDFDGERRAEHYAAARYLLYWLQESERLLAFHARFAATASSDPTGEGALLFVTGERSLGRVAERWRSFVAALDERMPPAPRDVP